MKRFGIILLLLFCSNVFAADFSLTVQEYTTRVFHYPVSQPDGNTTVIFLHGKGGHPQRPFLNDFYTGMYDAGIEVIAPVMPWSRWDGDREQALAIIDAVIRQQSEQGRRSLLVGHSMGAMMAMHYAANHNNEGLIGVVAIAPGHLVHHSSKLRNITAASVRQARQLRDSGEPGQTYEFADLNDGEAVCITTPPVYLSFFDPEQVADIDTVLSRIDLPLLWLAGERDRLNSVLDSPQRFALLPASTLNRYQVIPGTHKSVTGQAPAAIADWLAQLPR